VSDPYLRTRIESVFPPEHNYPFVYINLAALKVQFRSSLSCSIPLPVTCGWHVYGKRNDRTFVPLTGGGPRQILYLDQTSAFERVAPGIAKMSSCVTEVQRRSPLAGSPLGTENKRPSESPHRESLPKKTGNSPAKDRLKRTRVFLSHITSFFRKCLSVCLSSVIWLFLADFLFQFVHVHRDGKSLAGEVHALVSLVQTPLERVIGFDARYQFPVSNVDFMPLIMFVVLLILRNRADFLLAGAECLIRGEQKKAVAPFRSHSGDHSDHGLNNPPPKARKPSGDDRHALRTKVLVIHSE
jgi:hypothetical protein